MKIETLIVTVDREERSLAEKMNVQTDAVIGNQCGHEAVEETNCGGNRILWLDSADRGVGRNRNQVLNHASADICILADDDMRFLDGYPEIARRAFEECADADILIFNLMEKNPKRYRNTKVHRIRPWNYAKYGAARLAFQRDSIERTGITFHTMFGGGCRYSSGEDTIFLRECLKKKLKIYGVPYALAEIDQEAASTWFTGYHEKYFFDRGALYAYLYPRLWLLMGLRFLLLKRKKYSGDIGFYRALRQMVLGAREIREGEKKREI